MNIKVDNVTKIIKKVKVLDHVSLEFESGEITGLKGINGSGKTMIMRIISGLIRPTEGKVFINGRELKKEMDFPESIGVLIDSPAFLEGYSAYDNLRYMASVKNKVSGEEIKDSQIASSSWTPSGRKLGLPQPLRLRKQCQGMLQRVLLECSTPDSSSEGC